MAYTTIDNPEDFFKCVQWTGNDTEPRNIDVGFQTDLNFMKDCSIGYHYRVFDSVRTSAGIGKALYLNVDALEDHYNDHPEIDYGTPHSNGFKIVDNQTSGGTTGSVGVNKNNSLMTSWNWKCNGGTASTNTDGDINSTVQVNQDAGLSIVAYSPSNTTARTIGHGLGTTPDFIAIRNRTRTETWRTSWGIKGWGGMAWNEEYPYNTTSPSSLVRTANNSTFTVGTDYSVNGNFNYIAYCWKAIQGYSKFGDYYGNGQTSSGTFVHTGFKPAMIIIKSIETGVSNMLFDNVRDATNIVKSRLKTNTTDVPATNIDILDFRSNGFQLRVNDSSFNTAGHQYMYFAFAESPFVSSNGVPTTAR